MLSPSLSSNGYHSVSMDGKTVMVHSFVADWFLAKDPDRPITNHKNGIKTDNRISNLERVTYSENLKHAYALGLRERRCQEGSKNGNVKLKERQVVAIRLLSEYFTGKDLSIMFNCSPTTVSEIKKGKSWRHLEQPIRLKEVT